jgi:hypothetical protein
MQDFTEKYIIDIYYNEIYELPYIEKDVRLYQVKKTLNFEHLLTKQNIKILNISRDEYLQFIEKAVAKLMQLANSSPISAPIEDTSSLSPTVSHQEKIIYCGLRLTSPDKYVNAFNTIATFSESICYAINAMFKNNCQPFQMFGGDSTYTCGALFVTTTKNIPNYKINGKHILTTKNYRQERPSFEYICHINKKDVRYGHTFTMMFIDYHTHTLFSRTIKMYGIGDVPRQHNFSPLLETEIHLMHISDLNKYFNKYNSDVIEHFNNLQDSAFEGHLYIDSCKLAKWNGSINCMDYLFFGSGYITKSYITNFQKTYTEHYVDGKKVYLDNIYEIYWGKPIWNFIDKLYNLFSQGKGCELQLADVSNKNMDQVDDITAFTGETFHIIRVK